MKINQENRDLIKRKLEYLLENNSNISDSNLLNAINELAKLADSEVLMSEATGVNTSPLFKTMVDFAAEGMIYQDASGKILQWNNFAEKIFGIKANELVGKNSTSILWQIYREDGSLFPVSEHPSIITLKTGSPCSNILMKVIRPDKSFSWIKVNTNPVINEENRRPDAVVITFSDVTEQKNIETELSISEQKYRLIAENSGDNITLLDMNLNITYVSPNIIKIRGFAAEEANNQNFEEIFTPASLKKIFTAFREQMQIEQQVNADPFRSISMELEEYHKNGSTVWMDVKLSFMRDEKLNPIAIIAVSRDITEKRKLQDAIRESEEKFMKAFQNSPVVITITDLKDGKYVDVNNAFVKETGYSKEEAIGKTSEELNLFAEYKEREMMVEELKKNGFVFERECINVSKSGELINALVSISIITIKDQNYMLSTVVNITGRKKAEEAIKFNDRIVKYALDMICVAGFDGYFKELNPSWSRVLGWSTKELLSKPWLEFVHPDDRENTERIKTVIVNGRETLQFENRYLCKHGGHKWLSWNSYPYPEENVMFCIARDITEQKLAQRVVFESEEKYRLLAENTSDVIWKLNLNSGKFDYISPAIFNLRGYTVEEAMNESFADTMTPESRQMIEIEIGKFLNDPNKEQNYGTYLIQQYCKNGELIWVETSAKGFVNKTTGQLEIHGVSRNVNDRKIMEDELIKTREKAIESDKLKSAFLANMSHEIRTPMNGILGFSEMLEDVSLDQETRENYVNIIRRCGNQLLTIVNDLIDISKIEANQLKIVNEKVNVNEIIYDLLFIANNANVKSEVEISVQISQPDKEFFIYSDGNRLRQIVNNLLQNAIKYTNSGTISFGYNLIEDKIVFFIQDTGIGIPPDQIGFIFDRFKQIDNDMKKKSGGVGLGLAITKSLVDAMGGKIDVQSEVGVGTLFTISFSVKKASEFAVTNPEELPVSIETVTEKGSPIVLVVEDELYNFIYLRELLTNADLEILHAENGEDAIDMMNENSSISLVLMDIRLPSMDGIEATRKIKESHSKIPVIAQTAYAVTFEKETIMKSLFDDYLDKPINKNQLFKILNKYLKMG